MNALRMVHQWLKNGQRMDTEWTTNGPRHKWPTNERTNGGTVAPTRRRPVTVHEYFISFTAG